MESSLLSNQDKSWKPRPYKKGFLKGRPSPTKSTIDWKENLRPLPMSIKLIKTRDWVLTKSIKEDGRDMNPRRPPSKWYLISFNGSILLAFVKILYNHNNLWWPRKITKKDRAPKIGTKTPSKDLPLMAYENDLQQFTTIWNEECLYL